MAGRLWLLCVALSLGLVACDDAETERQQPDATSPVDLGAEVTVPAEEALFRLPHDDGNSFACSSCHALQEPAEDGIRRAGHEVGSAAGRTSFKNGRVGSLLEAVNSCRQEWMTASAWSEDDADWLELRAFLEEAASESGSSAESITFSIVEPPADLSGGDIATGQDLFNTSCSHCHGTDASGTERAPRLNFAPLDADYIARRVRTSGVTTSSVYDGLTGGRMPFWSRERMTDDELRHIVAWVVDQSQSPPDPPDMIADLTGPGDMSADTAADATRADASPNDAMADAVADSSADMATAMDTAQDMGSGCAATHSKIGQTATLSELFHNVAGTATIVDDCTIRLDNFSFDGGGIDVRIYAAPGGNYTQGFPVSPDLVGPAINNQTLILTLPAGRTLNEVDGISVWCVDVAISFGDGLFQ